MDYRRLYATDASVYEQVPSGVELPGNAEDCIALVKRAHREGTALIGRGGGTSIAGQCVGDGIVVDFSRYMDAILGEPLNATIWVQPGVVLDDLNDYLRPFGKQFPIDISTSSRCTIGGMMGNNAAGSHSIVYGTTRDNILAVDAVLSDGTTCRFTALDEQALQGKLRLDNAEGNIYRTVVSLIDEQRDAILAAYPDASVIRRNTGYAMDVLARGQPWVSDGPPFNLASLICGSEGTLALVTAIQLCLSPLVGGKALLCAHFDSVDAALRANIDLLEQQGLAACELIDAQVLHAAAGHPGQKAYGDWVVGDPAAVLAAEFFGSSARDALDKARRVAAGLKAQGVGMAWPVLQGVEAQNVWHLRKAGLGLIMGLRQRARPVAVIEDSAVPVQSLPAFSKDIARMMKGHGLPCVYYGHASVGLLHLRPALDLDDEEGKAKFRSLAGEVAVLVKRYRGALSGEHGDGRLRAPYLREFLGGDVYAMLHTVKRVFDPTGIFNPGKILSEQPVDADVRRRPQPKELGFPDGFDWRDEGGFDLVLERCNGTGSCRQRSGRGAMCPTFQATGEELHATRGRANLLRQAYSNPDSGGLRNAELVEAMQSCLSCKACQSECPSGVDMARMKAEFLYHRRSLGGFWQPARWLVAMQPGLLKMLAAMPSMLRASFGVMLRMNLTMHLLGLERKPPMPVKVPLSRRSSATSLSSTGAAISKNPVLLLIDPFINHLEPDIGEAAISVLQRLGYSPKIYFMDCSLRFLVSEGFLDEAKAGLLRLSDALAESEPMSIIGLEPSELLLLREEAPVLMGAAWREGLEERCFLLQEFLLQEYAEGRLKSRSLPEGNREVNVHPHCHERNIAAHSSMVDMLSAVFGLRAHIVSSGCCGMGGAFGYRHYDLSGKIFHNNVHMPADGEKERVDVIASGTSCRHQFRDMMDGNPRHLAEFLDDLLHQSDG